MLGSGIGGWVVDDVCEFTYGVRYYGFDLKAFFQGDKGVVREQYAVEERL